MSPFVESMESRLLLSATPIITATQKQDIQKLESDLAAIHANSDVTTAEIKTVSGDLIAIAEVAHKPSAASVQKLKTAAKADFAGGKITPTEKVQLTAEVQAVLASAGVPSTLSQQTATAIKAVIVSSNVTSAEVQAIVTDVQTLIATF